MVQAYASVRLGRDYADPMVDEEAFSHMVADAIDALPPWVAGSISNVEFLIEDRAANGERLLGLYEGVPLVDRGAGYSNVMPDRITLFRMEIEAQARGDEDRLRSVISHTLAHEIAHHLGISDERLLEIDAY